MTLDDQLKHLPGDILLAIAKNDSADMRGRRAATRLLYLHNSPQMHHKDIEFLLKDVMADVVAEQEVVDTVEGAVEAPLTKPPVVGVTTASLAANELIDNR